jgi:hypothetical protein
MNPIHPFQLIACNIPHIQIKVCRTQRNANLYLHQYKHIINRPISQSNRNKIKALCTKANIDQIASHRVVGPTSIRTDFGPSSSFVVSSAGLYSLPFAILQRRTSELLYWRFGIVVVDGDIVDFLHLVYQRW